MMPFVITIIYAVSILNTDVKLYISVHKSSTLAFLNQHEQENAPPKVKGGIDKYCPGRFTGVLLKFKHVHPVGLSLLITLAPFCNVASSDTPADPKFCTFDVDSDSNLYQINGTAVERDIYK